MWSGLRELDWVGGGVPWGWRQASLGPLPSLHFPSLPTPLPPPPPTPTGQAARITKETEVRQREVGLGGEFFPDVSVCGLAALGLSLAPAPQPWLREFGQRVQSMVLNSQAGGFSLQQPCYHKSMEAHV